MRYLHTMIRTTDLPGTIRLFEILGMSKAREIINEEARYTLVFMKVPDDPIEVEITFNWDQTDRYSEGRNFGHLAFEVEDIYGLCQKLIEAGVTINRPPRDGKMAFIRTPDCVSIELVQRGQLDPAEPWLSMPSSGSW
jgi:lactoylglutathione lyase